MRAKKLEKYLAFAIQNQMPVLLVGQPGAGKTDIMHTAAKIAGADMIVSHPVVSDPVDYKGFPALSKDGKSAHFIPFGDTAALIAATKPTIFFADDLGQAPSSVQAAYMQLVRSRRINGHRVSPLVTFFAATNRREDRAGVQGILAPLKDRFNIVTLDINAQDWVSWAVENGVDDRVYGYVLFNEGVLTSWRVTQEIANTPTPRGIEGVSNLLRAGLPREFWVEGIAGHVGEAIAHEMVAFFELRDKLPSFDEIVAKPTAVNFEDRNDIKWSLMSLCLGKVEKHNCAKVCQFIGRLSREYQLLFYMQMLKKHKDWAPMVPEVSGWVVKNANEISQYI